MSFKLNDEFYISVHIPDKLSSRNLTDIYGDAILDIQWNTYYRYLLLSRDDMDPIQVAHNIRGHIEQDNGLNEVQMLYVVLPSKNLPVMDDLEIRYPDNWAGFLYDFFLFTPTHNKNIKFETAENLMSEIDIGGKTVYTPAREALNTIRVHEINPGKDEIEKASKLIYDEQDNFEFIR